jgi:aspartyl-tRNA(Asn)/glutamyl-tRNA(Gln) amidotransferase subunit A
MDFSKLSIKEINTGYKENSFSAKDVALFFLEEAEKKNPEIFCYLEFNKERILSQAQEKKDSILSGIPFAIKDNIMVQGVKCTAGSKMLENYVAPYNATVVEKLREKGAVVFGKTNMDEFAMGSSTEQSSFGVTRNPLDKLRVPGGSSGGSAAAVAAGLCSFALGSDTGGSIRQPASFCGVVGLKPTYGAVSRYGLMAMASSLDQIGCLTRSVEDAEIVFSSISGKDDKDSTSSDYVYSDLGKDVKELVVGIPQEYFVEGIDSEIKEAVNQAIEKVKQEGFKVKKISLPHTSYALATYYIIMPSEVSANMARYDGIRYGLSRSKENSLDNLTSMYFENRKHGLGTEVKRRIVLGNYTLSAGHYDAYYKRAQKVRALIAKDFENAFQEVDLILTPVTPTLPFKIGEKVNDPLSMYLSDAFTVNVNLAGLPAMSMPCGQSDHLSVGIQIIAKPFRENDIFKFGKYFEKLWNK